MDTGIDRNVGGQFRTARMLIGGEWREAEDGRTIKVENPANRGIIGEVPQGGAADVDLAVAAATEAFPAWSRVAPRVRGRMLTRIADAMEARSEELARLIALEGVMYFPSGRA